MLAMKQTLSNINIFFSCWSATKVLQNHMVWHFCLMPHLCLARTVAVSHSSPFSPLGLTLGALKQIKLKENSDKRLKWGNTDICPLWQCSASYSQAFARFMPSSKQVRPDCFTRLCPHTNMLLVHTVCFLKCMMIHCGLPSAPQLPFGSGSFQTLANVCGSFPSMLLAGGLWGCSAGTGDVHPGWPQAGFLLGRAVLSSLHV